MTGVSGQTVVMFIGAGLATVGIAFILYWKLLAERRFRLQRQAAPVRETQGRSRANSGKVLEEVN